jgi:hypothetical protein
LSTSRDIETLTPFRGPIKGEISISSSMGPGNTINILKNLSTGLSVTS